MYHLVMDAYSRAIVGYDCSESLAVEGALGAMRMAIRQLGGMAECDSSFGPRIAVLLRRIRRAVKEFGDEYQHDTGESLL